MFRKDNPSQLCCLCITLSSHPVVEFLNQVKMERAYYEAPNSRAVVTDYHDGKTYLQCVRRYLGRMTDLDCNIKVCLRSPLARSHLTSDREPPPTPPPVALAGVSAPC